jgi:hydroxymethylpyrimidine kinase/phosphomethylpyrimidine kinase
LRVPSALTIAGSDSGGGAGIQADLKTFSRWASTARAPSAVFVREQILQVATDFDVAAAKTGMLSNPRIVETVADSIKEFAIPNLVVDPVFMSKNQDVLLSEDSIDSLVSRLFPLATVITPNLEEAALLTGMEIADIAGMKEAAKALHAMGPEWVLVKGGHLGLDATDVLYNGEIFAEVTEERIVTFNTHGTGCTLSAAIAAYLALGSSVPEAVWGAKEYVTGAIRYGLDVGQGYGPTNHGWDTTMKPGGF